MDAVKTAYHHGDLRVALIEAALEIIDEDGPQGLTIRKVAQRAGVSHAAPYRHFAGKDDLVLAVVERGFELLNEEMAEARARAGDDLLAQFASSGEAYLTFAMNNPTYYRVMFNGNMLSAGDNEGLRHTSAASFERMTEDIRMCQELGVVREGDPGLLAIAIVSTVHGFVSLANDNRLTHIQGRAMDLDELRDFVVSAIFEGVGAPS